MRKSLLRNSAGCAAIALVSFPAGAQSVSQQPGSGGEGLADIIVTAQKRSESIQRVPVAVTPYSAAMIEKSQIRDISELSARTPGLLITELGTSANTPSLGIRGISMQEIELSSDSGIGLVIDGVPLSTTHGALLQAFDVERIEVLRGPQGLLFGKNTTGGTINVIRIRPDVDGPVKGKARVTLGSYGRTDFEALLSGALVPGRIAVLGSFQLFKDNGKFRNTTVGGRDGDKDLLNYRVAVSARPADGFNVTLSYEHTRDRSEPSPYYANLSPTLVPLGGGYFGGANYTCLNPFTADACIGYPNKKQQTVPAKFRNQPHMSIDGVTLQSEIELGEHKIVGITGYRRLNDVLRANIEGTKYDLFVDDRHNFTRQYSQELRFESGFDGPLNFIAGAFYYNSKYHAVQLGAIDFAALPPASVGLPTDLPPGVLFLNSVSAYDVRQRTRSAALFFQANYQVTDTLQLVVGARQTWDRKVMSFTQLAPFVSPTRQFTPGTIVGIGVGKKSWNEMTPKVGVNFQMSPTFLAYASYSKGYNAGGFNGRAASFTAIGPYNPEKLNAVEFGIKSEWLDRRLRVNVAGYVNRMKGKQEDVITTVGGNTQTTTVNAATTKYRGVELEVNALPVPDWTISANGSYIDAKYSNFIANLGQGVADFSGLTLRRTPKWTLSLSSDYVAHLGGGDLGFNAGIFYMSSFETNVLNDPRGTVPKRATIDASIRYEFDGLASTRMTLTVFGKNLTDNETFAGVLGSGNTPGTFVDLALPQVGRTWGVSLAAKI